MSPPVRPIDGEVFVGAGTHWESWTDEQEGSRRQLEGRVRESVGEWVSGLREWDLFVTLTYDSTKVVRGSTRGVGPVALVGAWKAQRDVRRFVHDASVALGRPLPAVVALEPHKTGGMHGHGLLDVGGLSLGDIKRLHPLWFERNGYVKLEVPRSQFDVSQYCGKYMAKSLGDLVFSRELQQAGMKLAKGVLR